jgi:CRISPR-associated protein Cmr1
MNEDKKIEGIKDRYHRRKTIKRRCRIVTPMFLGGADQQAEWRAAPFKALLRNWWRVTRHNTPKFQKESSTRLREEESALFGFAGESGDTEGGKSDVLVIISSEAKASNQKMPFAEQINHPEMDHGKKVDPLLYLANMGLMSQGGNVKHSYFPNNEYFCLTVKFPMAKEETILEILALLRAFGTVGGRSRNGWGSFQIENETIPVQHASQVLNKYTKKWEDCFAKDYPNSLGRDNSKPLLWKTQATQTWPDAMRALAEAYIGVRAQTLDGIGPLNPDNGERHLLGIPLTHHNPEQPSRYSSPLRFIVRQKNSWFVGYMLHIPHAFSQGLSPLTVNQQIEVWKKVHRTLDHLVSRANYQECL